AGALFWAGNLRGVPRGIGRWPIRLPPTPGASMPGRSVSARSGASRVRGVFLLLPPDRSKAKCTPSGGSKPKARRGGFVSPPDRSKANAPPRGAASRRRGAGLFESGRVMSAIPLTARGAERLQAELHRLKTVDRPEVINAIAEARAQGDLSENAEYDAARERQGFIEGRIQELEGTLSNAQIINP